MTMQLLTLILFTLGGSTGIVIAIAARQRTHHQRFNLVSAGMFGALFGGLALPRILQQALPFSGSTIMAALLCAALAAWVSTTILIFIRHRLVP